MAKRATLRGERVVGSKHNFREFDTSRAGHIKGELVQYDEYYDLTAYTGGELMPMPPGACEHDLIHEVYKTQYLEGLNRQNDAYAKQGHRERCRTLEQLETNAKTRPLEFIFQCGDMHEHISGQELKRAFELYLTKLYQACRAQGIKCHLISASLHLDEKTPHIHYKLTFGADMERGGQMPRQEECFRQAGLTLPNPAEKESRYNNRLMTFTEQCRALEHEVLQNLGHDIETKPRPNMRHKDTRDYYTQSAINREKELRATVDRLNAKYAAERAEIAVERAKLDETYQSHTADLNAREKSIIARETLVKHIQSDNTICLGNKQYDIIDILKGLEQYRGDEVGDYIDRFTNFFREVAEQGRADLADSTEDEGWDDKR